MLNKETLQPLWLGYGLHLILLAFWILDSLKDPLLGALTDGNLEAHQPPAKLVSVATTLVLVCLLEYLYSQNECDSDRSLREGHNEAAWSDMPTADERERRRNQVEGGAIFVSIGVPYCLLFGFMAYLLQFNASVALNKEESDQPTLPFWYVVGYFLYAAIESFGSIAVATFWSFVNSTLSLEVAEQYYGLIIAVAQLGAIFGSTMVTTKIWDNMTLIVLSTLIILLQVIVMTVYSRRYKPTSNIAVDEAREDEEEYHPTSPETEYTRREPRLWSGVHLILKHNYVILILFVSSLYEISVTCLDYQFKLLGWATFALDEQKMSFAQFMGHYGQMVNALSLVLSFFVFPYLIRYAGLRQTLRLFPTLLLLVNIVAFGLRPGNLTVLFFSLSLVKAMTYSIHDPAKEILYIPTANAIKFKSKFWIDVVGARIAKAIGSSINTYAGSVDRSIRVASAPSLFTAAALWYACFQAGGLFDRLVRHNAVVGVAQGHMIHTTRIDNDQDGDENEQEGLLSTFEDGEEEEDGVEVPTR